MSFTCPWSIEYHWAVHKKSCHPFSKANTVTLKPDYNEEYEKRGMIGTVVQSDAFTRNLMGIPTEPTPERHSRGPVAPKFTKSKSMIIKVQAPLDPGFGDLLVYTKKMDFFCLIRRVDKPVEYDRVSQVVRNQGVGSVKAYFTAELVNRDELVVKILEILATQPW